MKVQKMPRSLFFMMFPAIILAFMAFPPVVAVVHGMLPSGELIYPGVGIDTVKIGEPRPARLPPHLEKSVKELKIVIYDRGNRKIVERITVSSPDFILARSQLRVQSSTLEDVLRYYGKGIMVESDSRQTIRFPSEGLELEINRQSKKVESISVFPPMRPKIQIQQYKMYKEQFKQSR